MRRLARVRLLALGLALWATAAPAQTPDWPSERPPRPLAAREVNFPPYETRTLASGMQVIVVPHHEQPAVTMRLLVRTGSVQDPPGKVGVASLAGALLDQGTTTRSAGEIADQIDFIGGAMGTGSGSDLTFANVVVMNDSFGVGMDLLADIMRNPAFAPEEIERQKQQAISTLQVNDNDPAYVASVLFDRLVYGFHPYGLPAIGTPETMAGITRADLQAYHQRTFVPNNMVLAIVGDITTGEAFAGAERVFGGWPPGTIEPVKTIEPPPPTRRIVIVDMPGAVQTEIRVGQLAIPRNHPDYMAWDLAVKILGGEGANRLHRVLRSERGLTYGAAAETEARKQAGDFVAETNTRTETTGEALRLMLDEFSKLARERVSERELSDAQAYLAGSFPLTIETPNQIATQILNVLFFELPVEEIATFRERVQAVTPEEVQRVSRQYIRPDRLSIVLVGDASAFVPQLRQVGFSDFEVIPIGELDLMSATLRTEAAATLFGAREPSGSFGSFGPFAYTRGQVNPRAGDAGAVGLLRAVIDAKGGLQRLKQVRTVIAEADTAFQLEQGTLVSTTRTHVAYPDRFRVDADVQGAEIVQVFNAGEAWMRDPGGVHDVPAPMRDDFAASVRRDTIPMLIAASDGRLEVRMLPEEGRDGGVLRVLEISGEGVSPVTLYIGSEDLIASQMFTAAGPDGRPEQAEEIFSDYRDVQGIQVPFRADLRRRGQIILTRTLTGVTFNESIDEQLFTRPQ